jgi:hypothetical protein
MKPILRGRGLSLMGIIGNWRGSWGLKLFVVDGGHWRVEADKVQRGIERVSEAARTDTRLVSGSTEGRIVADTNIVREHLHLARSQHGSSHLRYRYPRLVSRDLYDESTNSSFFRTTTLLHVTWRLSVSVSLHA